MVYPRRQFIKTLFPASFCFCTFSSCSKQKSPDYNIKILTTGPRHHFFGYYGICPWNKKGDKIISLQCSFQDHMPLPDEPATIGLVDTETGKFTKVSETHAWNFQQGAMLHWHPKYPDSQIIFNDREGKEIISVVLDINTGEKRVLPRPVNAISHNGKYALCLTYGRLGRLRKVVGYAGIEDPNPNHPHPADDGVFFMDIQTGKIKLIVSFNQVYDILAERLDGLKDKHLWFNHVVFNKSDTRLFFLARMRKPGAGFETGMFTVNTDGSELREVIPFGTSVSHFDWRNDEEIIATFKFNGPNRVHVLFTDGRNDYKQLGEGNLDFDGHCSFAPAQNWLVTDCKLKATIEQAIMIYNVETGQFRELGRFDMRNKKFISGDLRCDFHPRWNRTGDQICFDGIDSRDGTRQLHIVKLNNFISEFI